MPPSSSTAFLADPATHPGAFKLGAFKLKVFTLDPFKPEAFKKTKKSNGEMPGQSRSATPEQETETLDKPTPPKPRRILCAHCGNPITHTRSLCDINGDSEHRCLNPAGIYFHIQCYLTAPGCMRLGPSTAEHCWFGGYHWQLAYCSQCQSHLGWHYNGRIPNFFGLIKNRLRADTPDQEAD